MATITLETTGSADIPRCDCCGEPSRTVWGLARRDGAADAAYWVHWTPGKVRERGANVDLMLGRWGEGATPADRFVVTLEYRLTARGGAFMVIDAGARAAARQGLATHALRRHEVVGTPLAARAFELVDAIWLHDPRIGEITETTGGK
ncbi:MAG TPA: hypothetical protein VJU81_06765 [Methylomirabilota bacterium]|nr:hypothetical protein [Methylomirabilota bacterium]